jgi:hypothetical protein
MTTDLNPDGNPSIREAIKEYEDRTLLRATKATPMDVFAPQGILTTLGPVHAITYTGTLQGDAALYEHTFEGEAGPLLVVDETNAIHLVGGEYHVSDLGIEDGAGPSPRSNPKKSRAAIARLANQEGYKGSPKLTAKSTLKDLYFWLGFNGHQVLDPKDRKIEGFAPLTLAVAWQEVDEFSRRYIDYDRDISNPKEKPFSRAPLGSGGRFAACVAKVSGKAGVYDPEGLCASIGRKKYGAKKMAAMARAGRRNPSEMGDTWIQLSEMGHTGEIWQAWLQTAQEVIDQSDDAAGARAELAQLFRAPIGEWVTVGTPLENKYPNERIDRFQWRVVPARLIDEIEATESVADLGGLVRSVDLEGLEVASLWDSAADTPIGSLTAQDITALIAALRGLEWSALEEPERLRARKLKGLFASLERRRNPRLRDRVVTNRVGPNSPVENAGELAMAMPGGGPYGLPQVNAGALAVAPNYPGDYDFPGVTNGSHGLLGPQIRRNVPGQPIANPARRGSKRGPTKKDLRWTRNHETDPAGYNLSGPATDAVAWPYKPRSTRDGLEFAEMYEAARGQKVPKGTKWALITYDRRDPRHEGITAHKTLASAKRKALHLIRADWAREQ